MKFDKKEWVEKLRPFWSRRMTMYSAFMKQERFLEQKMRKKLGEDLEFFYVDGECIGIGHKTFKERKRFPLIHDSELQ